MTNLLAPNGKPSNLTPEQYKLVRTPAFKKWFGDWENDPENSSKVVDENNEPLVVYHGTDSEFYKFDKSKGKGKIKQKTINFSSNKDVSKDYGNRVIECFLNIKNPFVKNYYGESYHTIDFNARYENKFDDIPDVIVNKTVDEKIYDGVIFKNIKDSKSKYSQNVPVGNNYYAFNNKQIKLADGTNTTFDGKNPDIRFDGGGETDKNNMDSINIYEKRMDLLKESLSEYLKAKDNEEIDKKQKGKLIADLSNEISKSQYAIAEDLKGNKSEKLLVEVIKANNILHKRDRYDIWCIYAKGFEIEQPFFSVLESNGLTKPYYEKSITFSINPEDYRLNKIMEEIIGTDDLRPMMKTINYVGNSAIGTDAHKLLHVTGNREGNFEDGSYFPIKEVESDFKKTLKKYPNKTDITFDWYKKAYFKLDGNYPNWLAVLPNEPFNKVNVNIPLLYSLLKNFIENNLLNPETYVFKLEVLDLENNYVTLTLNAELFVSLFKSFLLLGMKDMQMCFSTPNKGVFFTEVGLDWDAYTKDSILTKTNFGLLMPVYRYGEDKAPVVKINENGGVDLIVNTNVSHISKESLFSKSKKQLKAPVVTKISTPKSDDYLKGKINAFELLLEIETDKNEIQYLKDKIEAFKMLSDL